MKAIAAILLSVFLGSFAHAKSCRVGEAHASDLLEYTLFSTMKLSYLVCNERWLGDKHPARVRVSDLNRFTDKFRSIGSESYETLVGILRDFNGDRGYSTVLASVATSKMRKLDSNRSPVICLHLANNLRSMLKENFSQSDFRALAKSDELNNQLAEESIQASCE